jgi:serine/threonine protein kinase
LVFDVVVANSHPALGGFIQVLQDIHQCGIIHCDISPNNVVFTTMLPGDNSGVGSTVVLDFGLALQDRPLGTTWCSNALGAGTHCFIAPEMQRPLANCSHKVNIWSTGVVIAFQVTTTTEHGPFFLSIAIDTNWWLYVTQLLGLWPDTDKEAEAVAQLSFTQAIAWAQHQHQERWYTTNPCLPQSSSCTASSPRALFSTPPGSGRLSQALT